MPQNNDSDMLIFLFAVVGFILLTISFKIKSIFGVDWETGTDMMIIWGLTIGFAIFALYSGFFMFVWPSVVMFIGVPFWKVGQYHVEEGVYRYFSAPWFTEWYIGVLLIIVCLGVQWYVFMNQRRW